jgi:hypothetical protein
MATAGATARIKMTNNALQCFTKNNSQEELTLYSAASYSLSTDAMAGLAAISRETRSLNIRQE